MDTIILEGVSCGPQSLSRVTGIYVATHTKFPCHFVIMHGRCCPSQCVSMPISREHHFGLAFVWGISKFMNTNGFISRYVSFLL